MSEEHPYMELMLKQSLDVMIECIAQPVENISRLGCSCIRLVDSWLPWCDSFFLFIV